MSALLLRPAPMPAIEMAGFECVSPVCFPGDRNGWFSIPIPISDPAVEMAGFAKGGDTPGTQRAHKTLEAASNRALAASQCPLGNEFHNRMRSTSLSVISSFVRS